MNVAFSWVLPLVSDFSNVNDCMVVAVVNGYEGQVCSELLLREQNLQRTIEEVVVGKTTQKL